MKRAGIIVSVAAALSLVLYGASLAGDTGRGGYAGSFLRMGLGARALGMGGGSAVFLGDASVSFYNPAGLVFLQKRYASASISSMSLDRSLNFIGYGQSVAPKGGSRAGVGVGWIGAGVSGIDGRDFNGNHTETYSSSENCFYLAFAHAITPRIAVGLSTKILYYALPRMADSGTVSAKGVGFDIGVIAAPVTNMLVGITVKDLHSRYTWNTQSLWDKGTQKTDMFPVSFNAGGAVTLLDQLVTVHVNYEKIDYIPGTVSAGAELLPADVFALRAGLYRGGLCFGTGVFWKKGSIQMVFDYAYVAEAVGPANTHVLSGTLMF